MHFPEIVLGLLKQALSILTALAALATVLVLSER